MKTIQTITLILLLTLLAATASAIDYKSNIRLEIVQNNNGELYWNPISSFNLTKSETKTISSLSITLIEFDSASPLTQASFSIAGGSQSLVALRIGTPECIKGNCAVNGTVPKNQGDMRLIMTSIEAISSTTSSSTSSSDAIEIYVKCSNGEKLFLDKDSENNYDPTLCSSKNGWSTSSDKTVELYLHRNLNVPISTAIVTSGSLKEELYDSDTKRFILSSNDKYEFKITIERYDSWGGKISELFTYTITTTGLGSSSSSTSQYLAPIAPYDVIVGETKEVTLPDGTFSSDPNIIPTKMNTLADKRVSWSLNFMSPGSTTLQYTPKSGSPISLTFNIRNSPKAINTPIPTPLQSESTSLLTAKQSNSYGSLIIFVSVALLIVAIYLLFFNRGSKNTLRERFGKPKTRI